jgi:hypothetical protein
MAFEIPEEKNAEKIIPVTHGADTIHEKTKEIARA